MFPHLRLLIILTLASLVAVSCASSDDTAEPNAPTQSQALDEVDQTPADGATTPSVEGPTVVATGQFEKIGYEGSGVAELIDAGRSSEVRFTDFQVEQGPALRVYLSGAKAGSPEQRYIDDFVDLGKLRAFDGDQGYDVPPGTPKAVMRSVVIWCAEFSVGFVVAPLDPV